MRFIKGLTDLVMCDRSVVCSPWRKIFKTAEESRYSLSRS
jgi:hypothetical protein